MLTAALVLLVAAVGPALLTTLWGDPADRLTGLILAGPTATMVLLLLSAGYHRPAYLDVALVLGLLSFAGSLVYARFIGRTL
ncbi:monovalent cation/H+ antiporter complex subunit F [Actinoallomurus rhizosphaericola]|uniref:monovalent cation/H+ antiporter complex subunit F n=1 Tax=Actinoallomurus rhizosphaericola TaxID=2952536 RepID=UPI002093D12E|nr:monovalent cation/H+ antiporter complex subunit F [Actinoallomurus rhizosphaericola]MCO5997154.1 monovalent cation/H+ antiporter complex subunit F [Actinoallomurus rhizosphaericola]